MSYHLSWERDGRDWPNREYSRFIEAGGLRWHVQVMGQGPVALLLHGTGASTHSFRDLAPLLAKHFTVVAPDLPGHGFTAVPKSQDGYTLPGVSAGIGALLDELGLRDKVVVAAGHSAGAAITLRMCLDGLIHPVAVISLNGALLPFPVPSGFAGVAARWMFTSGVAARVFSFLAGTGPTVERVMRGTGSVLDADGLRFYRRLAVNQGHVAGAMALMGNWDLHPLLHDLPQLRTRLVLVNGSKDGMVPASEAYRIRALMPKAELISLPGLGHLAHEERPGEIAALVERIVAHEAPG
nr:alpha/beta fold hydrolase BchO [uncultured Rhodopila sp.]